MKQESIGLQRQRLLELPLPPRLQPSQPSRFRPAEMSPSTSLKPPPKPAAVAQELESVPLEVLPVLQQELKDRR